jgi:hypothetical protein
MKKFWFVYVEAVHLRRNYFNFSLIVVQFEYTPIAESGFFVLGLTKL